MWDPSPWVEQRPSFLEPVPDPGTAPCDPPLVCISINQSWVPYIVGACSQLIQPTTWDVSDHGQLLDLLGRVADLLAEIGTAMPCSGTAPTIPGQTATQTACNMAGYLAHMVVREAMKRAIQSIQDGRTVIDYGLQIITAIPGAGLVVNFLIRALSDLYDAINGGTLSDYQSAVADDSLWGSVTCAIFNAISAQGSVTDGNFGAIVANVGGISYPHSDVIGAIVSFLDDVGAGGLASMQATGAVALYDCSGCGGGTSTGPLGTPVRLQSGSVALTITVGNADATAVVVFPTPFDSLPVVVTNCDDPLLIGAATSIANDQFTAQITAAVPVISDTSAVLYWQAAYPGDL